MIHYHWIPIAYQGKTTFNKNKFVHSSYIVVVKHVEYPSQEIDHFACHFQSLQKKAGLLLHQHTINKDTIFLHEATNRSSQNTTEAIIKAVNYIYIIISQQQNQLKILTINGFNKHQK